MSQTLAHMKRCLVAEWFTVEQVAERLFGADWCNDTNYLAGKEWVRQMFYDGGELPSERVPDRCQH